MFTTHWMFGSLDAAPCLTLRKEVLQQECGWPEDVAFDWYDGIAAHLLVRESGVPVASARIFPLEGSTRIDSICVLAHKRGVHYGDLCTRLLLYKAEQLEQPWITALVPAGMEAYYQGFGFSSQGKGDETGRTLFQVKKGEIIWDSLCKHEE